MWFGYSIYSIYTVHSVHFNMLLISHKYSFSFSELIKDNVSGHDTVVIVFNFDRLLSNALSLLTLQKLFTN